MLRRIYQYLIRRLLSFSARHSTIMYWKIRALAYGRQSVLHSGHGVEEYDEVTERQKKALFPLLRTHLHGDEQVIVDFGCGPGRFTVDLAKEISGTSIGVDPIGSLLSKAPKGPFTSYKIIRGGRIPLGDCSVDVVWVCLVLGGIIRANQIQQVVSEIDRCLKPGGLLFLIENTAKARSTNYWCFRSVDELNNLFDSIEIEKIAEYDDLGQEVSVMTGRKRAS